VAQRETVPAARSARARGTLRPVSVPPAAVVLLAAVSVATAVVVPLVGAVLHRQTDLSVYRMGAGHVGDPHLYDLVLPGTDLRFTYPPFAAVALAPVGWLPQTAAQVVWSLLSSAALLALIAVAVAAAAPGLDRRRLVALASLAAAGMFFLEPVRHTFALGQVNLLLALAVLVDLVRVGPRRRGVLTGVAAAVKLTPLVFVPYLWLSGQRRAALRAAVAFTVAGGLAALIAPTASRAYWRHDLLDTARVGGADYVGNQSLKGVLFRLTRGPVDGKLLVPLVVAVAVAGLVAAARTARAGRTLEGLLGAATVGILVSPVSWSHHLVWAVPALAWLCLATDRPRHGRLVAAAAVALLWAAPQWWVPRLRDRELHHHGWQLLAANAFCLGAVAFLALLVRRSGVLGELRRGWRRGRLGPADGLEAQRGDGEQHGRDEPGPGHDRVVAGRIHAPDEGQPVDEQHQPDAGEQRAGEAARPGEGRHPRDCRRHDRAGAGTPG
jgi:alpha-1,2-mannosyltransferase